jgi:hypothetical protein
LLLGYLLQEIKTTIAIPTDFTTTMTKTATMMVVVTVMAVVVVVANMTTTIGVTITGLIYCNDDWLGYYPIPTMTTYSLLLGEVQDESAKNYHLSHYLAC